MSDAVLKLMAKIVTHIPEDGDLTLVILKGHLILEEELNAAVASRTPHSSFLVEAELEFDQLLLVAKSQYFTHEQSWVWGAAKKLNTIRNLFAHNLEPPEAGKKLEEFLQLVEGQIGIERATVAERLRRSIAMVAAQIHQLRSAA